MELTLMEKGNNSTAHSRVKAFLPPFAAAYAEVPPCPVKDVFEPIFTIEPLDFFSAGRL